MTHPPPNTKSVEVQARQPQDDDLAQRMSEIELALELLVGDEATHDWLRPPHYHGPQDWSRDARNKEVAANLQHINDLCRDGEAYRAERQSRASRNPRVRPPDGLRTKAAAAAKLGCAIKQPQKHKAKTPQRVPSPDTITPTTPLRLDIAAQIAFPDGSIGVSGLRREIERGNLRVEQIAGKTFTTLANIEDMRKKCAIPTKGRESSSENHGGRENPTDGSSSTAMPADVASSARQAHLRQVAQGLRNSGRTPKKPSPTTSDESTSRNSAAVIRLKSE
jgi:hypothetical protein